MRLRLAMKKLLPFIITADHHPQNSLDSEQLRARFVAPAQLALDFGSVAKPTAIDLQATLSGEM